LCIYELIVQTALTDRQRRNKKTGRDDEEIETEVEKKKNCSSAVEWGLQYVLGELARERKREQRVM
jgi:hypothetical protein